METETTKKPGAANLHRRAFLQYAGAGAAAVGLLAVGCKKDSTVIPKGKIADAPSTKTSTGIDIGSGDLAILNYAYALEQLEAAFYIQIFTRTYPGMSDRETQLLKEIRDHEVIHREFFKAALGKDAIPDLVPDFSQINFANRIEVLKAAKAFEDTGVAAYDGAGYLIKDTDYLTIAGKIVSVEARHASYIRNLVKYGDYAGPDVVDANGLNNSMTIAQVLAIANTFLKTKVSASYYNYTA